MSRAFVIYVIELIQLGFIHIKPAPQNDHQHLNFVKDVYVVGKKWPEMVVNWPNAKVVSFFIGQSLVPVKSKVEISQNFVAFSKYMNFNINLFFPKCYGAQ